MSEDEYVEYLEKTLALYRTILDRTRESCLHAGMYTGAFHAEAKLLGLSQ